MKTILKTLPILALALSVFAINDHLLVKAIPLLYLCTAAYTVLITYDKRQGLVAYYRPSSVMAIYVSVFFFMGSFAFANGWVLDVVGQLDYYYLGHLRVATFFFICAVCVTLLSQVTISSARGVARRELRTPPVASDQSLLLFSLTLAAITLVVDIGLPGGVGSFSSTFFMIAAIHISYHCKTRQYRYRYGVYGLLSVLLAVCFYTDRRLVAFYAFTVSFLELYGKAIRIQFRSLVTYGSIAAAIVVMVIAMSIQRGVGEFGTKSVIDAVAYVDDYLMADWAMTMLFHNFEGPATTFHSYNAVDYILETRDFRYGSTVVKALFLPVSRDYCTWKPRSMVDEYTTIFLPELRARGVSFVPNLYAEALWNFGIYGGLTFLFAVFSLLDGLYYRWVDMAGQNAVKDVLFLSCYAFLPFYFRGSGLELYVLCVLICLTTCAVYWLASGSPAANTNLHRNTLARHTQ